MKAKVTKDFRGKRDGAAQVEDIKAGAIIEGDLARVAVAEKWAKEIDEVKEAKIDAASIELNRANAVLVEANGKFDAASEADKVAAEKAVTDAAANVEAATKALAKLS